MLYPILTESRLMSDLSGIWSFRLDNGCGFDEKWFEKPLEDRATPIIPLLRDEALQTFVAWEQKEDKTEY